MVAKDININYVNPFIGSACDVFRQIFECELKKGKITVKSEPVAGHEVAIMIGITGSRYTGVVIYSMKDYTAKKIVNNLVPDLELNNNKNTLPDALGELANMISGKAMVKFAEKNINLNITTPSVIVGDAFKMHLLRQTTLSVDMMSPFGTLEVNVAIKDNQN